MPSASEPSPTDDVARLAQESDDRFAAAIIAGDGEGIAAEYVPDAVLLFNGFPEVRGHAALVDFFLGLRAGGLRSIAFVAREIQVFGDVAVEIGDFTVTGSEDGAVRDDSGRYTLVRRRSEDGTWKVTHDIPQSMQVPSSNPR